MTKRNPNIAILGYAGAGKTTLANMLVNRYGYQKFALGGLIKKDLRKASVDSLSYFMRAIKQTEPYDIFREVQGELNEYLLDNTVKYRNLFELWGLWKYDLFLKMHFDEIDSSYFPVVIDRVCDEREVQGLLVRGYNFVEVICPGCPPETLRASEWLHKAKQMILAQKGRFEVVANVAGVDTLVDTVADRLQLERCGKLDS